MIIEHASTLHRYIRASAQLFTTTWGENTVELLFHFSGALENMQFQRERKSQVPVVNRKKNDRHKFGGEKFEHLITVNRVFLGRYNGLEKFGPSMRVSPSNLLGRAHIPAVIYLFLSAKLYS